MTTFYFYDELADTHFTVDANDEEAVLEAIKLYYGDVYATYIHMLDKDEYLESKGETPKKFDVKVEEDKATIQEIPPAFEIEYKDLLEFHLKKFGRVKSNPKTANVGTIIEMYIATKITDFKFDKKTIQKIESYYVIWLGKNPDLVMRKLLFL